MTPSPSSTVSRQSTSRTHGRRRRCGSRAGRSFSSPAHVDAPEVVLDDRADLAVELVRRPYLDRRRHALVQEQLRRQLRRLARQRRRRQARHRLGDPGRARHRKDRPAPGALLDVPGHAAQHALVAEAREEPRLLDRGRRRLAPRRGSGARSGSRRSGARRRPRIRREPTCSTTRCRPPAPGSVSTRTGTGIDTGSSTCQGAPLPIGRHGHRAGRVVRERRRHSRARCRSASASRPTSRPARSSAHSPRGDDQTTSCEPLPFMSVIVTTASASTPSGRGRCAEEGAEAPVGLAAEPGDVGGVDAHQIDQPVAVEIGEQHVATDRRPRFRPTDRATRLAGHERPVAAAEEDLHPGVGQPDDVGQAVAVDVDEADVRCGPARRSTSAALSARPRQRRPHARRRRRS